MDIDGLGREIVKQLVEHGLVKTPVTFTDSIVATSPFGGFGDKKTENLFSAIKESRDKGWKEFLFGLGIRVGEHVAGLIAKVPVDGGFGEGRPRWTERYPRRGHQLRHRCRV